MTPRPFAIMAVLAPAIALAGCNTASRAAIAASPVAILADGAAPGIGYDPCALDPGTPFWRGHGGSFGHAQSCGLESGQ
jgi:hypothetical protein